MQLWQNPNIPQLPSECKQSFKPSKIPEKRTIEIDGNGGGRRGGGAGKKETRREWLLRWHSASYCFIHGILCGVDTTQDMEEKGLHGSWPMVGACCSGFCLGCQLEGERNMSTGCESRAVLIKHYPSVKITEIGCNISDVLREGGQPGDSFSFSFPVQLNSKICCAAAAHPACRSMTPGREIHQH